MSHRGGDREDAPLPGYGTARRDRSIPAISRDRDGPFDFGEPLGKITGKQQRFGMKAQCHRRMNKRSHARERLLHFEHLRESLRRSTRPSQRPAHKIQAVSSRHRQSVDIGQGNKFARRSLESVIVAVKGQGFARSPQGVSKRGRVIRVAENKLHRRAEIQATDARVVTKIDMAMMGMTLAVVDRHSRFNVLRRVLELAAKEPGRPGTVMGLQQDL